MLDTKGKYLLRILQEHGNNRVKRELRLFWGMHNQDTKIEIQNMKIW